ncbi:LCI family antimicrobial peptide [Bacillus atrophaeus]|uniref:LCI family antimicrobial peptide n=1 Tax=Bacillus atrophaeus TaxID=1452 RepID=UPI00227ED8FB|nr:LCI family antimicrobial peptide [Bacillus atrophaeus]MCY8489686.1 hypothetical protein [Bacillus atrophaeus]MCY8816855.1 hypothetical protein [Bacillus atrophaeus]
MKMKKVLTGSALSLAMLVSAAPALGASPITAGVEKQTEVSTQAVKKTIEIPGYSSRWSIPNTTVFMGSTFYLKDARQESNGTWTGIFEGWYNG